MSILKSCQVSEDKEYSENRSRFRGLTSTYQHALSNMAVKQLHRPSKSPPRDPAVRGLISLKEHATFDHGC